MRGRKDFWWYTKSPGWASCLQTWLGPAALQGCQGFVSISQICMGWEERVTASSGVTSCSVSKKDFFLAWTHHPHQGMETSDWSGSSHGHLCGQPRMGVLKKVGGQHHPKLIGSMGYCGGEGDSPREGMLGSKSNFHRAFTGFLTMFPGRPFFVALPCTTAQLFPRASLAAWPTGTSLANSTTLNSRIRPCKWLF